MRFTVVGCEILDAICDTGDLGRPQDMYVGADTGSGRV